MIIYVYFLVCIFQYFYSINFEIGKNNLKTELCLRCGRILAEQQRGTSSRRVRSTNSHEKFLDIWLKYIEEDFFDNLNKLTESFTPNNTQNFLEWMYQKGRNITNVLNLSSDPEVKSFFNKTLTSWRGFTDKVLLDKALDTFIQERMLNAANVTTNLNGSSSTSASSHNSPSTSISLPTPTESSNITTLPISTLSPESTVSPTTALSSDSDLSSSTSFLPTISSDSHNNSTTPIKNTSDSPTILSTNEINTATVLTNNPTALIPTQHGGGLTGATCTGLLCGPAFVALPVSVALLGGVFFFVLLYMYTPVGKFLGRDNPKKKKAKKRLNEIPMECINSPKLLKVKRTENAKRSRLHRFLRAFGYDKNFPYIDEDIPSDQASLTFLAIKGLAMWRIHSCAN
ncbi:PIR-like protein [Plasmodium gallinaceum]|uniref:PIR-like protein n=1 Tax=Plasmodium gallinaceum TaxID=5849 RepID=A0A1J1GZU4_PLAGA|nr:PIR-like protein [Plasmodium gallinaceum]CRG96539.1 PIR-like protein [Plasmodium gallinaceum]